MNEEPITLRDAARGVAVRTGFLGLAALVTGVWIYAMLLKFASAAMRALLGVLLMLIAGGLVSMEVKKAKRRIEGASPTLPGQIP